MNSFPIDLLGLVLTTVGLLITVAGIFSTRRQTKDLAKVALDLRVVGDQTKELPRVAADISTVGERLSTRYLGQAPDYYPELKGVIDGAKRDLFVSCTLPAIGFFSHYHEWVYLENALKSTSLRVKVKCVFGMPRDWETLLREQFREAVLNWNSWAAKAENANRVAEFSRRFGSETRIDSWDSLYRLMETSLKEIRESNYHDAEVVDSSLPFRMFAWVADSKEAVFVLPSFAPNYVAYAFWTRDSSLISALMSNHQEHLELTQRISGMNIP